jgi:RHS repeat-associated protein
MTENLYNMLGEPVYTYNIDSGRRWIIADVAQKPIRMWDNQHREIENAYDTLQRPVSVSLRLSASAVKKTEKIVYGTSSTNNQKGQAIEQYDQSGKTTISTYDFKGNLLSLSKQLCSDYQNTIDWDNSPAIETETFAQSFVYDAMNRPTNHTKPDSTVEQYGYNKAALLETVKAQVRGAATWTNFITNINYNEKGQRTDIYYNNGSKTAYTYDDENFRLCRLLTTRNTGTDILQDINYTYDPEGNITEIEDDAQQTFYYSNSVIEPKGKYYYDALYRLTKATGRELSSLAMPTHSDFANNIAMPNTASNAMQNFTQQYNYDQLGNMQQMQSISNWTRDYFYNTNDNYLLGHTDGTTEYTYDSHGNMLSMPHLSAMAWDYKDQLKQVDLGGGGTAYYVYDASGERTRKVIEKTGGIVEQRIYLGGFEIYRKTISSTLNFERETLRISDDRKAIVDIETKTVESGSAISSPVSNIRYQYDNHLGSASLELDANAAIISYEEYHPFGTTSYRSGRTETEVSLKRYKYVGKERDEETGLYYYGARYYAGWICRFVSVDAMAASFPNFSPFAYSNNNPLRYSDPTGNQTEDEVDQTNHDKLKNLLKTSLEEAPKKIAKDRLSNLKLRMQGKYEEQKNTDYFNPIKGIDIPIDKRPVINTNDYNIFTQISIFGENYEGEILFHTKENSLEKTKVEGIEFDAGKLGKGTTGGLISSKSGFLVRLYNKNNTVLGFLIKDKSMFLDIKNKFNEAIDDEFNIMLNEHQILKDYYNMEQSYNNAIDLHTKRLNAPNDDPIHTEYKKALDQYLKLKNEYDEKYR